VANPVLANFFFWYLLVECDDSEESGIFHKKLLLFRQTLMKTEAGKKVMEQLNQQKKIVEEINQILIDIKNTSLPRQKKKTQLTK